MFFDGIKPTESSLNEDEYLVNNYANILSFIINENNRVNELMVNDIYPLTEEAIIFDDEVMFLESVADGLLLTINSLKQTMNKVEDIWNKFMLDHEKNRKRSAKIVTKALTSKSPASYSYTGYIYNIRRDNIYVDHSLVNSENLIARQLSNDRVSQLKAQYGKDDYYDKIRGHFLSKQSCTASDFPEQLKLLYRNNQYRPKEIRVTDELKEKMIDAIYEVDENIESCKLIKNSVISYCKSAITYLEKMHNLTQVGKTKSLESRALGYKLGDIENLANIQIKNIRSTLNIYATVMTVKMDIINERQRVYTKVLREMSKGGEQNV